jgi:hypothetical protein
MFVAELKTEFLERVEIILNREDLTDVDKKSIIGKLFVDFEKRNKSQLSKLIVPPSKEKRQPTDYNNFIKEKMGELKDDIIPSKLRFKTASGLWKKR